MLFPPETRTSRIRSKETAINAFIRHKVEIDGALERLQKLSADHFNISPDAIDWGHVGTVSNYAEALKRITDQAFSEGEFAGSKSLEDR